MIGKDREPAFPLPGNLCNFDKGLSVRDYFAGQALAGLSTLYATAGGDGEQIVKANARIAYEMADAMILERDK